MAGDPEKQPQRAAKPPMVVPSQVDDMGLSTAAFRVYAHLCRRANGTGDCWPAAASIASTCRINKDTVWTAVRELEKAGLIQRRKAVRNSNLYHVVPLVSVGGKEGVTETGQSAEKEGRLSAESEGRQSAEIEGCQSAEKEGRKGYPLKESHGRESIEGRESSPSAILPVHLTAQEYQLAANRLKITEPQTRAFYSTFRLRKQPYVQKDYPNLIRAEVPEVFVIWMTTAAGKALITVLPKPAKRYDLI